ncbi:MFS transporter [Bacillus salitolerans]|uniref:MFS transporter n=1 Tax=Bacillus salitolerans TaxID=1437434 RepID=A0ABW4LQY8_9BACI
MKDIKLFIAAFFSSFGSTMYLVIVAWVLYELTSDAAYTGLMVGLGFLPGVFLNLVFGIWVDRANRKKLTTLSTSIILVSIFFLLIPMYLNIVEPWMIITVHMCVQTFSSLFRTAQQAFITEIYENADIPRIFSHVGSVTAIAGLVGTSVGGFSVAIFNNTIAVALVCLSFIITLLCISILSYTPVLTSKSLSKPTSIFQDLIDSFTYIHRNPLMYILLSIMLVGQLVVHNTTGMLSVYTSSHLNGSSTVYGILESAASVGAILAGIVATTFLYRSKALVPLYALVITALGLLGLWITQSIYFAFVSVFFIGLGTTLLRVLMQSIQQVATEPAFYGRMAATRQTVNQTSVVVSAPILGIIAEHLGIQYAYASLVVPVSLLIFISYFFSKDIQFRQTVYSVLPDNSTTKQKEVGL